MCIPMVNKIMLTIKYVGRKLIQPEAISLINVQLDTALVKQLGYTIL